MSTAYSSAKQKYIGNGVTTEWGFDFPIQKHSELKVYLKRSSLPQVLLEEGVDYSFVTENTIAFPIKAGEAKLQATDVLALQRESVFESEYNFSNQQRLEPEEVMHADDNLERQIQELKRDSESSIKVQPTSNINTDEYFIAVESIYENLDNITNVSGISAEIVNCSNNIEAIQDAPNQANAASQSASNAAQSASDAAQSATNAADSATASANSATDSANSATASANSASYAAGVEANIHSIVDDAAQTLSERLNTPFFFGQSMYSDVAPDNASWLVSNGQYNARSVYPDYYDWLLEQMNAGVSGFVASTAAYTDYDFVINTTDQTFRLPLKNGQEGVFADGVKGNGIALGLTNGTDNFAFYSDNELIDSSKDGFGKAIGTTRKVSSPTSYLYSGVTTDPSKSGMIVDKTVPSGWNLYYYVGDTVQDASLINAGAVLGQLSNKANIDASNFNADGKSLLSGLGMPSGRYIDLTLGASGSTYTAPANGWFCAIGDSTGASGYESFISSNNSFGTGINVLPDATFVNIRTSIPCKKGDVVELYYSRFNIISLRFIYAEGEN